ncbi:MAG TPA: hypothetical protein VGB15_12920 [Longimicrobium sp.]
MPLTDAAPDVAAPRRREWVEVEPGAPLPPEAPPWAERHALVKRGELADWLRRPALGLAVAMLAGAAVMVMMGELRGYAAVPVGLALLWAGWTGGVQRETFVPSPDGRYVQVELPPEPVDPAEELRVRKRARWAAVGISAAFVSIVAVLAALVVLDGFHVGDLLVPAALGLLATAGQSLVEAVKRRTQSEALPSERFLQLSDPRQPLPDGSVHLSGAAADDVEQPAAGATSRHAH